MALPLNSLSFCVRLRTAGKSVRSYARVCPVVAVALFSACTLLKKSDSELYGDHPAGGSGGGGATSIGGGASSASGSAGVGSGGSPVGGGASLGGYGAGGAAGAADSGSGGSMNHLSCPTYGDFPVGQDPEWGHCFVAVTDKLYFGLAELTSACQSLGANFQLASIRSSTEAKVANSVYKRLRQDKYLMVGFVQDSGASALDKGWSWLDGSPTGFGPFVGWAPMEPNDGNGELEDGTEDCAGYIPAGLVDIPCSTDGFPLCEGSP